MVLTLRRAAFVALITGMHAMPVVAQRSATTNQPRTGEARPLLYGFALECIDCAPGEGARGRGAGQPVVLSYRSFPHVIAVAPGSAAEHAGIKEGDVLKSIDGFSVITDTGAKRLARAAAGQQVKLGFERNSKPIAISLVLGPIANPRTGIGPERVYGGYIAMQGAVPVLMKLEIWSDDPIIPTDPDSTNSFVIRIGTGTIIKVHQTKDSTGSLGKRPGLDQKLETPLR
jgi:membrane-associated protease RseP (regulator of RpoE activity)